MATTTASGTDPLAAGRAALERAAWEEARAFFEEATAGGGAAAAWDGLAQATWWQGDEEATFAARERAFRLYREAGDVRRAAWVAMWIASDYFDFRGDDAVAAAWLRRGRELLEGEEPGSELGFIALLECDLAFQAKRDPETARAGAAEALEFARRIGDADVEVVALAMLGSTLIACGEVEEGLERLAECVSLAVAEDFYEAASPGWAYCHTVAACADVGDFGRAEQWCDVLHSWSANWRARHFFGVCRTAYGEVLAARGEWKAAEEELRSAIDDLEATRPALAGPAAVRLGHLRLRQGKEDEARALFERALPLPQAVIAGGELDLAAGDATAAAEAGERVLRNLLSGGVLDRFPALELLARANAARGDHERARELAAAVERDAERLATPYMRGRAAWVEADVLLAAGDHEAARRAAEDAVDLFAASSAPYECAHARLLLAGALESLGRGDHAEAEARAARETLALLGAARQEPEDGARAELTVREVEILRLVADGLGDNEIAARLFLSPHTVHRHMANIRTKLRAPSRAAAVAHATRLGLL
jgi:ATP/maltotriose-dependent transcriptional regulator MalT